MLHPTVLARRWRLLAAITLVLPVTLIAACGSDDDTDAGDADDPEISATVLEPDDTDAAGPSDAPEDDEPEALTLTSTAFGDGATIPLEHACARDGGTDLSPALEWSGVPEGTTELALVVNDPDAPVDGGFPHWVLVDIPADLAGIEAGGSAGTPGSPGEWIGMCPPQGETHTYVFTLHAFTDDPELEAGATRDDVLAADAAATAELKGTHTGVG